MQFEDNPEVLARFTGEIELVDMVVRQLRRELGPLIEVEDMQSFGREGLLDAARRFEPDRGIKFRHYANYRVRGAILDGLRATSGLSRRAYEKVRMLQAASQTAEGMLEDTTAQLKIDRQADRADVRLAEQLSAMATAMALGFSGSQFAQERGETHLIDDSAGPEEMAERSQLVVILREEIAKLPESERKLIHRYFYDDVHLEVAAKEQGLSKSWGSRVLARAMLRLSRRFSQVGSYPGQYQL